MQTATAIVRQGGEGERMWFAGGGTFTWKATGDETVSVVKVLLLLGLVGCVVGLKLAH